ncbi:peptide deformylase, partial [Streptomyces sp. NPDC127110]|uniref:peptide deformylase n=1 Tax=Streptomyces sp. NPDC127110 TaxID=3345362 RepID=UPI00364169B9
MRQRPLPGTTGSVRPMTLLGEPVLHSPCAEVTDFGPELDRLVEDMFATMYAAQGVGLAANQIGTGLRVFVYDCPDDEDVRHVGHVVNPRLVETDGDEFRGPEGCLSLPGLEAGTVRVDRGGVGGVTSGGAPVRVVGTGLLARGQQPEFVH